MSLKNKNAADFRNTDEIRWQSEFIVGFGLLTELNYKHKNIKYNEKIKHTKHFLTCFQSKSLYLRYFQSKVLFRDPSDLSSSSKYRR